MRQDEPPLPTPAELEVLKVLWDRGPRTVREVHEGQQFGQRPVRYTTTLKLLQNLHDKGLVRRDDTRRSHVFESAVERESVETRLVSDFVNSVFEGSASRLVLRALSTAPASPGDLDRIRQLADRLEREGS